MIASLRGTVGYVHPPAKRGNFLELEVNGVGYRVEVPARLIAQVKVGQAVQLFTHLEVREDAQELFGFDSRDALQMFLLLLSVRGIGPRSALHVLDVATPLDLRRAVTAGNAGLLTQAVGVGQRLAELIVAGLRGKLEEFTTETGGGDREASDALVALGFPLQEAQAAVAGVKQPGMESEEVIRAALKALGRPGNKRHKQN